MPWKPRRAKWDWRSFLTQEERAVVRVLERSITKRRAETAADVRALGPIRNRAIQRAKYDAERKV